MFVKDKETGRIRKCTNKIAFINGSSGGFICVQCTNKLHKRFSSYYSGKFKDADKYLKKWFNKNGAPK